MKCKDVEIKIERIDFLFTYFEGHEFDGDEQLKSHIAKYLTETGAFRFTNRALKLIDDCIIKDDPMLLGVCEKIVENEVCLLNRQPSLHRLSMVGFNIKVRYVNVIYIHPLVCEGFNADFDGDSLWSRCRFWDKNKEEYSIHISELKDSKFFKHNPKKEKENVSHYDPTEELTIKAISLEDGTIAKKKILDYEEKK